MLSQGYPFNVRRFSVLVGKEPKLYSSFQFHRVITVNTPKQRKGENSLLRGKQILLPVRQADAGLSHRDWKPSPSVCRVGILERLRFYFIVLLARFIFGKEDMKSTGVLRYHDGLSFHRMVCLVLVYWGYV